MATNTPLIAVEIVASAIWIGSLVCLAVVANVARKVLDGQSQVSFFRALGRRYALVGTGSLLVAIGAGVALSWPPSSWSESFVASIALSVFLILVTVVGMVQARAMTMTRRRALSSLGTHDMELALRKGRMVAGALRGLMAGVTLAVVVLVAQSISH